MFYNIICVLIIVFVCIYFVFSIKKENYNSVYIICSLFTLVKIICAIRYTELNEWDEQFHALVAKNLLMNPFKPLLISMTDVNLNYEDWTYNNIWLHKQPLTLWLIALSYKIFGISVFNTRIPSIIMSSILIILSNSIGKTLYSRRVGLITAFLIGMNGFLLDLSTGRAATDHIDVCFVFFITLNFYLCLKYLNSDKSVFLILAGIALGLSILTKWLPALIVLPIYYIIGIGSNQRQKKLITNIFILLLLSIAIASPWQFYCYFNFTKEYLYEQTFNTRHIFEVIENHNGSIWYHINYLRILYGELIYIPLIFILMRTFRKNKINYTNLGILAWILITLLFFSLVKTKMLGYTIICLPALYICTAYFIEILLRSKYRNRLFTKIIIIVIFALSTRYTIERIKPFDIKYGKIQSDYDYSLGPKDLVFNEPNYIKTMFHTSCGAAYPVIPSSELVQELKNNGFKIHIR